MIAEIGVTRVFQPDIGITSAQMKSRLGRVKQPQLFLEKIDEVLDEIAELCEPRICCGRFKVSVAPLAGTVGCLGQSGELVGSLTIGPGAGLLDGASECCAAVCTIGGGISERIASLEREGGIIAAYLMDIAGILAIDAVSRAFRSEVEAFAEAKGWGVGPVMQPGSLRGWPLDGQAELLRLLPVAQIGVRLSDRYMMTPEKSNSSIVGIGAGYGKPRAECLCEECARSDCSWRRTRLHDFLE